DVFPSVSLWEESTAGGDYLLIGSTEPFLPDPDRLRRAASHPDVAADLERVEIDGAAGLLSHFVMGDESIGRFASGARLHVEDRLDLEFTAPSALHRETLGEILRSLEPYRTDPAGLVPGDLRLAAEVRRLARRSREERAWAAGLGLMDPGGRLDPELLMALSWLRSGMKGAALEAMRDLAMRRPAERLVRLVLAHLLMSEGRVEDAARELATAVALRPDDARGRLYLARALYASGRIEEALGHNEMAVHLDPALAEAGSDRCAMLLAAGDIASAEAACLAATRLDADLAQAHANLGVVRAHRGRLAEAEASYRRAIELDPELSDPRYNLAALLQRAARWREGLETLGPLLGPGVEPDAAVLILAARLSSGAGYRSEAARYLEASRRLDPENPELKTVEVMLR
ncbi:MAG TPA: tetratricopeptide repeat protein, partial [Candidatus Polarisedimenticolia bacterium]|nr:tetratricopeptide repeat protein [Candidatus Polarisedimenticolia bacterium]